METISVDSQAAADAMVSRFATFYDGTIQSVFISVAGKHADRWIEVKLQVQNYVSEWFELTLRFSRVERFLFEESPLKYNVVLSDGVVFHVDSDRVIADLWPLPAGDVWVPEDIETAGQYVVAASCTAEVRPIT